MWGYQPYFRRSVEHATVAALARIGFPVEVHVVLVGFALSNRVRHQVCVEPEHGPLSAGHLSAVLDRADVMRAADPFSEAIYLDPHVHERWEAGNVRRFRAAALEEAITESGVFKEFIFFASSSSPIDGYDVHTCAGVPTAEIAVLPAFDDPRLNHHIYVGRSLQHEVIAECLRRADTALLAEDPGSGGRVLGTTEEIVQAAAVRLTDGMVQRVGGIPADLFQKVNAFTSLSYERAAAGGRFVVGHRQEAVGQAAVRFREPVPLSHSRIMRKLLELSDESTPVITDGQHAYGLGTRDPARGSRYNSAIRYQKMVPDTLLVVISDDGTVDLVPDLKPQVHRDAVEAAVQAFCETCELDPVDSDQFRRTNDQVKKLAFYLDTDQCQRVNQAHANEIRRRLEAGEVALHRRPLRPHPDMDDSCFY